MKKVWVLLILLLTGCSAFTGVKQVRYDRGEFAIMYADQKALISVWMFRVRQGCEQKKLSADVCKELTRVEDGLMILDDQAKRVIRQADTDVDWATIAKYAELAVSLAMKAAM